MTEKRIRRCDPGGPTVYQIRIHGRLGPAWSEVFDGLQTSSDDGDTLLTGTIIDQAALHGLLRKIRDLGLPLISINSRDVCGERDAPTSGSSWSGRSTPDR